MATSQKKRRIYSKEADFGEPGHAARGLGLDEGNLGTFSSAAIHVREGLCRDRCPIIARTRYGCRRGGRCRTGFLRPIEPGRPSVRKGTFERNDPVRSGSNPKSRPKDPSRAAARCHNHFTTV